MKKIYRNNEKKQVREEALRQFRETRSRLENDHPELLAGLRDRIVEAKGAMPKEQDRVTIDRKKNVETVLRFLEINPSFAEGNFKGLLSGKYH